MLAYVFWHWPRADAAVDRYEASLAGFHASLVQLADSPVRFTTTWAVTGLPWAPHAAECYADWYLVSGFGDLGRLNQVAVTAGRQAAHDRVASLSEGGTGGLYRPRGALLAGHDWVSSPPGWEAWFAKPDGCSYPELDAMLAGIVGSAGCQGLWQRQLTLGPGPEFCLVSTRPVALAPELDAVVVQRRAIRMPGAV